MSRKPMENSSVASHVTFDEMKQAVETWVSSTEGTAQLLSIKEAARIASEKVISDAQVDAEQLRKAITL